MNEYYVYEYWRLDNNTCFYVGKGKDDRCYRLSGRSKFFTRILNKTECAMIVIETGLTEKEAHDIECMLIHRYVFEEGYDIAIHKKCIEGTPYLVNSTWGGEGVSGNNNGKYHWNARKVVCLNTKETFETILEACEKYNLHSVNVVKCCKGKIKHSGRNNNENLRWMYYDDYIVLNENKIKNLILKAQEKKNHQSHKIICLETQKMFNSIEEAKDFYGLKSGSGIGRCLKYQRGTSGGYHWFLYDEYIKLDALQIEEILLTEKNKKLKNNRKNGKRIICVELSKIFDSIEEAKRFCNLKSATGIRGCLSGEQKTAGGYHWKVYKN